MKRLADGINLEETYDKSVSIRDYVESYFCKHMQNPMN